MSDAAPLSARDLLASRADQLEVRVVLSNDMESFDVALVMATGFPTPEAAADYRVLLSQALCQVLETEGILGLD